MCVLCLSAHTHIKPPTHHGLLMYVCVYVYIYVCTHTYTRIHTLTATHTHSNAPSHTETSWRPSRGNHADSSRCVCVRVCATVFPSSSPVCSQIRTRKHTHTRSPFLSSCMPPSLSLANSHPLTIPSLSLANSHPLTIPHSLSLADSHSLTTPPL
jgi:hypothetical protein